MSRASCVQGQWRRYVQGFASILAHSFEKKYKFSYFNGKVIENYRIGKKSNDQCKAWTMELKWKIIQFVYYDCYNLFYSSHEENGQQGAELPHVPTLIACPCLKIPKISTPSWLYFSLLTSFSTICHHPYRLTKKQANLDRVQRENKSQIDK